MLEIQKLLEKIMKQARDRLGYSQAHLAELIGVSTSFIGEIEIGRKCPSGDKIQKIADALGLKLSQLFADEKDKINLKKQEMLIKLLKELKDKVGQDLEDIVKKYMKK